MKPILSLLFICTYLSPGSCQWYSYNGFSSDTITVSCIDITPNQSIWASGVRYDLKNDSYVFSNSDMAWVSHSDDFGQNWETHALPLGQDVFVTSLSAVDKSTAYLSGMYEYKHAKILKTSDGGSNWIDISPSFDPYFSYVAYLNFKTQQTGIIISDPVVNEFQIYHTINGGASWSLLNTDSIPDAIPFEFTISGTSYNQNLWFTTSYGRIFYSSNYGKSWAVFTSPIGYTEGLRFSDAQHGILSPGYTSQELLPTPIFSTTDGGVNWAQLDLSPLGEKFAVFGYEYIPNSTYIMLTTCTGSLLTGDFATWISPDRGETWQQISSGENIYTINFQDASTGWGGEGQQLAHPTRMFQYTGSPLVGLFSDKTLVVDWDVFPNPTADRVQVRVQEDKPTSYLLLVNDLQGKLILRKDWDGIGVLDLDLGASCPSGMYTVTLASKDGKAVRKLVVAR